MTALFLLLVLTLQDAVRTLAAHPAFTARFTQTLTTVGGETLKDKGTIRFEWGKGLRFDYQGKDEKSFVFVPDGCYSRTGGAPWDFQPWDETASDLAPFLFLLNGKIPKAMDWTAALRGGSWVVESQNPAFSLQMDPATGWPRRLELTQADGSLNALEFSGARAGAEGFLP